MLRRRIGYMAKTSYAVTFVTFVMASNGYVTWHSPVASHCNVLRVDTCVWSWLQRFGDMESHGNITLGPRLGGMA